MLPSPPPQLLGSWDSSAWDEQAGLSRPRPEASGGNRILGIKGRRGEGGEREREGKAKEMGRGGRRVMEGARGREREGRRRMSMGAGSGARMGRETRGGGVRCGTTGILDIRLKGFGHWELDA